MDPADWLLLMVTSRPDVPIDPVRLQKGLFLIAMEGGVPGGEQYAFEPYSYGPMSRAIYRDARRLEGQGLLEGLTVPAYEWRSWRSTPAGRDEARALPPDAAGIAGRVRATVEAKSFAELLAYVYDRYPEYATRSVFRRR